MYTLCSYCKTLFRVNAPQLAAAQGRVRCGICHNAFSALDNLAEQPDDLLVRREPAVTARKGLGGEKDFADADADADAEAVEVMVVTEPIPVSEIDAAELSTAPLSLPSVDSEAVMRIATPAATADEFDLINAAPIVTEGRMDSAVSSPPTKRVSLSATLAWSTINLGLITMLAAQFAYFNRHDLAQYAELRPALEEMCQYAGCDIPHQRDITKITLLNRELRSHPVVANALLVTATLVNNASFHQPYPMLQLNLSDFSGRTVAMRHFLPAEYMGNMMDIQSGMPPGQLIEVSLELADPGKAAVGFEFNFI